MTPFRNDESNPFNSKSAWPRMPQAPIRLGALPSAASEPEARAIPQAAAPAPPPEPEREPDPPVTEPAWIPPPRVRHARREELRLTPLIAAGAVGAGGMAALFLLIGFRAPTAPPAAPAPGSSRLAVGELLVAPTATPAVSAPPAAAPALTVAPAVAPPLPARRAAPQLAAAAPASPRGAVRVPAVAAQPFSTDLQLPAPRPAASPVEPPPAAPPADPPYIRPPAPDREAPIPSHVPDPS